MDITEKDFATQVEDLLKLYGWKFYHVLEQRSYSKRTSKGFPDYVAVRPPRLIFAELKSEEGKLTPEQEEWLDLLRECQLGTIVLPEDCPEVYLWWPSQIEEIAEILK